MVAVNEGELNLACVGQQLLADASRVGIVDDFQNDVAFGGRPFFVATTVRETALGAATIAFFAILVAIFATAAFTSVFATRFTTFLAAFFTAFFTAFVAFMSFSVCVSAP